MDIDVGDRVGYMEDHPGAPGFGTVVGRTTLHKGGEPGLIVLWDAHDARGAYKSHESPLELSCPPTVRVPRGLSAATGDTTGGRTGHARRAPRQKPERRCEHCGAPTKGRFAVGHDSKLKKDLERDAAAGDSGAWAELLVRGWSHLVRSPIPRATFNQGKEIALEHGIAWAEQRSAARQQHDQQTRTDEAI